MILFVYPGTTSSLLLTSCRNQYSYNMSSGRLKVLSSFASRQGLLLKKFTFSVWLPVTLISSFHCGKLTDTLMRSNNYKSFHSKSKKESVNLKGSSIEGTVQQVLFESRETQYSVLEVLVHRSSCKELEGETIQVVGRLGAQARQNLISVEGNLTESERYGRQFRVKEKRLRKKGLTDRLKDSDLRGYCGKDTETIEIRVERILFTSGNSSQYAVMQCVTTESLEDVFTVVSYFGPLTPGSSVSICGKWVHHDKYGLQFHAKSCLEEQNLQSLKTELKKDEWLLETIQSYLSSHTVPGIGPVLAKRLCSYFGTRIEDVLEQGDMENLLQVRGLRQKSARALIDHFQEKGILRRATLGLMKLGFPLSLVSRILSSYGIQRSLFLVENDPYVFVEDLKGVGFKKIDRIARSMSPKFAVSRYRAAIKLALRAAVKEGHCFLYLSECDSISKQYETELSLSYQVKKLITDDFEDAQFDKSLFVEALEALETSNAIVLHSTSHETCVYLKKMYDYEFQLGALLKRYRAGSGHSLPDSLHLAQEGMSLEQVAAVKEAVFSDTRLCIITGGPGSGKTYTARRIVELWKTKYGSNNIALTAPTGRAAARLAECTGLTAQTIHRLLEYQPRGERGGVFKRNKRRPLDVDAVLVDEFSMVDIEMAFSLLNALKPDTKLVLIGDMFQLPSVGPGQKQRSSLIETASQIRLGTVPYLTTFSASHIWDMYQSNSLSTFFSQLQTDLIMIEEKDPSGAVALLHPLLDKDVWTQNNVSPYHDIQIISPGTKGSVGTIQLNLSLKQQLNPPDLNHEGHSFVVGNTSLTLHLGDKVFQKVNDYNRDVFNGDIGVVEGFEKKYSRTSQVVVHVRFMDRIVSYSSEDVVFNLSHAYALTVHKSQGSEFPVVFVVLFPMHYTLFNRSLLYTAVTRAKKLCVVIGTKRTLAICVKQSKESQRNSMLPHFF